MNQRIVELLKNPQLIENEDVRLLDAEIVKIPYAQSLRALQLFGIHKFEKERYAKELSTTAAYTTDKKILYQFINGKIAPKINYVAHSELIQTITSEPENEEKMVESVLETEVDEVDVSVIEDRHILENNPAELDKVAEKYTAIVPQEFESVEDVYFEGEKNRILFPGEENFLNEENTAKIDIESTLESGVIVTEKIAPKELSSQEGTPETIINEKKNKSEISIETIEASSELSFHGFEAFLPDVKIQHSENVIQEEPKITQQSSNKQEDEMKKLIEEVERKMREKKQQKVEEKIQIEVSTNTDINFSETQEFTFTANIEEPTIETIAVKNTVLDQIVEPQKEEIVVEKPIQVKEEIKPLESANSGWKPMVLESNIPDALINKKQEPIVEKQIIQSEEISTIEEPKPTSLIEEKIPQEEVQKEELPVINVSFFSPSISTMEIENDKSSVETPEIEESNVPTFINTWQDWLKIDRTTEIEAQKTEKKEKIIENFIETNPKISQLKEESSFVIKEKSEDISHLMTETLANLYTEQKLYAKAIKAFQILMDKHPEKKEYFEQKITEIKEIRSGK